MRTKFSKADFGENASERTIKFRVMHLNAKALKVFVLSSLLLYFSESSVAHFFTISLERSWNVMYF